MEGLGEPEMASNRRSRAGVATEPQREWRLVERWLVFLFVASVVAMQPGATVITERGRSS